MCETEAYSPGAVIPLAVGGWASRTGCATFHVICEAVTGPGVASPSLSAPQAAEGKKLEGDDEATDAAASTSTTVVAVAAVGIVAVASVLAIVRKRRSNTRSAGPVEVEIAENPAFNAELSSTHFYPTPTAFGDDTTLQY
jgi:hypothetical protein